MPDDVVEVVVTGPDPEALAALTDALVRERLCACGHVVASIRSIYMWKDEVRDEPEARVALHTRAALVPRIVERVRAEHPYEVPCVIALPLVGGNPGYFAWVREETREP